MEGRSKSPPEADVAENKRIVAVFVDAINGQDWPKLSELVAPNFVRHGHAGGDPGIRSRSDLVRFLKRELETFPDARETILDLVAEGDKVAARHRFEGTQTGAMGAYPPSNKRLCAEYLAIYRLEGGMIAEAWAEWDNLSGLVQLGHHRR